jgi:hypothetical protein
MSATKDNFGMSMKQQEFIIPDLTVKDLLSVIP